MKKVFYRCDESNFPHIAIPGKEYSEEDGWVILENGYCDDIGSLAFSGMKFTRIEREVFTANGLEWFKHVPGDPMPCATWKKVYVLLGGNIVADNGEWRWSNDWPWHQISNIIGWRYADEQKPESQESNTKPYLTIEQKMLGITDPNESVESVFEPIRDHLHRQEREIGSHSKTEVPNPTGYTIEEQIIIRKKIDTLFPSMIKSFSRSPMCKCGGASMQPTEAPEPIAEKKGDDESDLIEFHRQFMERMWEMLGLDDNSKNAMAAATGIPRRMLFLEGAPKELEVSVSFVTYATESQAADLFGYIHKTIAALNEPEPKKEPKERTISDALSADFSDKIFSGRIGWKA